MSDLAIRGRCNCGVDHPVPIPDESECRTQEPFERVVCGECAATVEDLQIMGSVSAHEPSKPEKFFVGM